MEESSHRLMKDNTIIYRKIRLLKLQTKNSSPQSQVHHKLETLAEVEMSLCDPEAAGDAAAIPNPIQVVETPEGQH